LEKTPFSSLNPFSFKNFMLTSITPPAAVPTEHLHLDADQLAVFQRELQQQIFGHDALLQMLKAGRPVPRDLARNILYLSEARNAELCELSGIETDGTKERGKRYERVCQLNAENHELQRQLGLAGTPAQTTAHLTTLAEKLNKWWDREGFGHVSKLTFTQYGTLEVDFSCHLFGTFPLTNSSKPVSDKSAKELWHATLNERGFLLEGVANERDPVLPDCDQNRRVLTQLFTDTFPSCNIVETTNHRAQGKVMVLRGVRLYIPKLDEVHALPME
jgi:hypothetical protein